MIKTLAKEVRFYIIILSPSVVEYFYNILTGNKYDNGYSGHEDSQAYQTGGIRPFETHDVHYRTRFQQDG